MPLGVELVVELAAVEDQVAQAIVVHLKYTKHVEWMDKLHHAKLLVSIALQNGKFSSIEKLLSKKNGTRS